jgi:hypothetical protein
MAIEPHLNNKINNPIKNPINKTHINSNPKSKSPNQKNSIIKTHINSLIHYPSTIIDLISLSLSILIYHKLANSSNGLRCIPEVAQLIPAPAFGWRGGMVYRLVG